MVSTSSCLLLEPSVLVALVRRGCLAEVCRTRRVGVGELTLAANHKSGIIPFWQATVEQLVADGRIEVHSASAAELAGVVRWVGAGALACAELELVALTLAGRGVVCTDDTVVWRVMQDLGIELFVSPSQLVTPRRVESASVDSGENCE